MEANLEVVLAATREDKKAATMAERMAVEMEGETAVKTGGEDQSRLAPNNKLWTEFQSREQQQKL